MELSQQSKSLIESAINDAVSHYSKQSQQTIVTDIHLQPNPNTGELIVFDDDDTELANVLIEEWSNCDTEEFYNSVEKQLREILLQMNSEKRFDGMTILKPFSFVLVDEVKETVADLLLIDDDTLLINEDLLQGLDKELDEFLKDLLAN